MAPPVVDILSDDDDDGISPSSALRDHSHATPSAASPDFLGAFSPSPPAPRRRSHATPPIAAAASPDFLGAFSPSPTASRRRSSATPQVASAASPDSLEDFSTPPLRKRPPSAPPIIIDDTPPEPKRRAPSVPPGSVVPETPQSFVPFPCSLGSRAAVAETPDSVLPRSFPSSVGADTVVAATPGFSSAASAQRLSGNSCPIFVDSDNEFDDIGYREPSTKLPSNTAKSQPMFRPGTSSCSPKVISSTNTDEKDSSSGRQTTFSAHKNRDSTLQEENTHNKEESDRLIQERKKKQEEKRLKKEEKARLAEQKKREREEAKMRKQADKAQQAEQKKFDKEKQKRDSGKCALKSIVAEIDSAVIESGSIGGALLTRFAEKDLNYRVKTNQMKGSILWRMEDPAVGQHPASVSEVPYILFVLQAEEFCDLINGGSFFDHVLKVRNLYPTFTICYVTNKLMSFIKKCEQSHYKNPSNSNGWTRPPVEKVFCKLATHYVKVHSRQCIDEAELAEHVVGLTLSLAQCKFRKPLTWLTVHANGADIPKNFIDKDLAKNDTWMKSLIAIPGVQPRFALAIWKKYRTMRSLLNEYMDPSKTDREKEVLLKDLKCEDRLGEESRKLGPVCSKRVFRILLAQNGGMDTADVEKS